MKSFFWFMTILLLCIELAHAAHITPIHVHRQLRHSQAKPTSRRLRRRGTCKPPTTNNTNINNDESDPSQLNTVNANAFPSLGFKMPSSVPSSLDGWWSDYKSEVGFLGFSYSVAGCMSLYKIPRSLIRSFDRLRSNLVLRPER